MKKTLKNNLLKTLVIAFITLLTLTVSVNFTATTKKAKADGEETTPTNYLYHFDGSLNNENIDFIYCKGIYNYSGNFSIEPINYGGPPWLGAIGFGYIEHYDSVTICTTGIDEYGLTIGFWTTTVINISFDFSLDNQLYNNNLLEYVTPYAHISATEPTEASDGNIEYYHNENKNIYLNAEYEPITEDDIIIEYVTEPESEEESHYHNYTYVEYAQATDTADGHKAHFKCEECGKVFNERLEETTIENVKISKHEHDYILVAKVEPTDTADGTYAHYTCECGKVFDEEKNEVEPETLTIPKHTHTFKWVDGTPATEEQDGVKGHFKCENCDLVFDEDYKVLSSIVIPKLTAPKTADTPEEKSKFKQIVEDVVVWVKNNPVLAGSVGFGGLTSIITLIVVVKKKR